MSNHFRCITILVFVIGLGSMTIAELPRGQRPENSQEVKNSFIKISPETTVVTEYLDENGFPDYIAALNAMNSKDVTPEENAEAQLWLAVGIRPAGDDDSYNLAMAQALGVKEEYQKLTHQLIERTAFVAELLEQEFGDQMSQARSEREQLLQARFKELRFKPWTKEKFPEGSAWLERNSTSLKVAHEAVQLPMYYRPIITSDTHKRIPLYFSDLPDMPSYRELARLLCTRAMLYAGEGRFILAQQDLIASHKLARLIARGYLLIDLLVGTAIESMSIETDEAFILEGNMPVSQLQTFRAELAGLPEAFTTQDFIRSINEGERLIGLDSVVTTAIGHFPTDLLIDELGVESSKNEEIRHVWKQMIQKSSINWNKILSILNVYYDQILADSKLNRIQRVRPEQELQHRLQNSQNKFISQGGINKLLEQGIKERSEGLADLFASILIPSVSRSQDACERVVMKKELVDVTIALAIYKTETGKLPETLAQLVPAQLPKIPIDLFNNQPLQYRSTPDGTEMILYSAGPNGEDNGGYERGQLVGKETDDIAIRSFDLEENEQLQLLKPNP